MEDEKEEEEENLEKAFSVACFQDIVIDSASTSGERMGRNYTEKDFESKQKLACAVHKYSMSTVLLFKEKSFLSSNDPHHYQRQHKSDLPRVVFI